MIRRGQFDASQAFADAWDDRDHSVAEHSGVRTLVRVARAVEETAVATPSDDFTLRLRAELMAEAEQILTPSSSTPRFRAVQAPAGPRRRVVGVAAALVATFGVVGTAASSASALPGDVMYPVKRGLENVQLAIHRDEGSRGEFRLQQARERLAEAVALQATGDEARVADSLQDFTTQAEAGADELFTSYSTERSDTDIDAVNDFVAAASVTLAEMSPSVPDGASRAFEGAAAVVSDLAGQASTLCVACSPADVTGIVGAIEAIVAAEGAPVRPDELDEASEAPADTETETASTAPSAESPAPAPSKAPALPKPSAAPTPEVPVVSGLLDPETGLLPSLLGGLLGGGKK